jgi:hypothetical protein
MSAGAAAGGEILTSGQRRAVERLGRKWGDTYDIGAKGGLHFARRDDGTGKALEAGTPAELDAAIRADRAAEGMR